jgi:hypothetical protein
MRGLHEVKSLEEATHNQKQDEEVFYIQMGHHPQ